MRRIYAIEGIPEEFSDWLSDNKELLIEKSKTETGTGTALWAFFKTEKYGSIYDCLKLSLVQDQGFICCYCGRRIEVDRHTSIEHIKPKSKYKGLIFNYDNLLASCNGSTDYKIHIVKNDNESLEFIAEKYGVDIELLEDIYVNDIELFGNKFDIENLSIGDRVIIIPKLKNEIHCDAKKSSKEIDITPLMNECEYAFQFNELDGKILLTDQNQNTVKVLGLNENRYINQLRKKIIDESITYKELLIANFADNPKQLLINRDLIISSKNILNKHGDILEPFVFIFISSLEN